METADGDEIFPYTPMFFDIWALRYLYSVNQNTDTWFRPDTNSGDDIYFIEGPVLRSLIQAVLIRSIFLH